MEDDRLRYGELSLARKLWLRILKMTVGYGYRPLLALCWIGLFVFVGCIVFGTGYRAGMLTPSDKDAYGWTRNSFVGEEETGT